jgi:hypothetical protein
VLVSRERRTYEVSGGILKLGKFCCLFFVLTCFVAEMVSSNRKTVLKQNILRRVSFHSFLDKLMKNDWVDTEHYTEWHKKVEKRKDFGYFRWIALGLVVLSLGLYWRALYQTRQVGSRASPDLEAGAALVRLRQAYDRWVQHRESHCEANAPFRVRCDTSQLRLAVVRPFSTKHIGLLERRILDWTTIAHAVPCVADKDVGELVGGIVPDLVFVYSASKADHEAYGEEFRERVTRAAAPLSGPLANPLCFRKIHFWNHVIDRLEEDVYPDATCGMFYELIERLASNNVTERGPYTHFMLMEPDVQPLQAGWLSEGLLPLACMAAVDGSWVIGSISHNSMDYRDYHLNGNALYAVYDEAFRLEYLRKRVRGRYRRNARVPFADGCSGTSFGGFDVSLTGYLFDLPMSREEWQYVTTIYHRFRATDTILNMGNARDWRPWSVEHGVSCRTMLVHGKSANGVRNLWNPSDSGWAVQIPLPTTAASKTQTYLQISRFLEGVLNTTDAFCQSRICDPIVPFPPRIFMEWIRSQVEVI